jgi:HPt (histidine-containing phosphotransfer) domain-containing protein
MTPQQLAAFDTLRQRFRDGLLARWHGLCNAQPHERAGHLHRLAGAAGSFGFEPLSLAARAAEQALDQGADVDDLPRWKQAWQGVDTALHQALQGAQPNRTQSDNTRAAESGFNGPHSPVEAAPWKSADELKPTTCS